MNNIDIVNGIVFQNLGISNNNFENRLISQKKIYILQVLGINLGFSYNWYVRGPYSPALTSYLYNNIEVLSSEDFSKYTLTDEAKKSIDLVNSLSEYKRDLGLSVAQTYELLASLLYIIRNKKTWKATDNDKIITLLLCYKPQFTKTQCENALEIIYDRLLDGQE